MIGGVVLPMMASPFLFTGEVITLSQWLGSLLLIPAAFCLCYKPTDKKASSSFLLSAALLTVACLSNALTVLTQKIYVSYEHGDAADFNLMTFIFCSITLGVAFSGLSLLTKRDKTPKLSVNGAKKHFIIYIFAAIVTLYVAQYFSTLASGELDSAYFFPLSYAIGMPLTLLTDTIVYKEKIKLSSSVGIALVIAAVILIGIRL